MTEPKRSIVANKRARNKRKKAQRSSAKAIAAQIALEEEAKLTACPLTPTDTSSADEAAANGRFASNQVESDDDQDDEDELVFVCRPTMQDFCTEYASAVSLAFSMTHKVEPSAWGDLRRFTVRIPAFRERDGYTTYTIVVTIANDTRKQFQVERRYSEFVTFATNLDEYLKSPDFRVLREKLVRGGEEEEKECARPHDNQNSQFQWELPPKTWFRMTQTTAIEERRSKLEVSLQSILSHDPCVMCHIPVVRDFLMLDIFGAQVVEEKLHHV